MCLCTRVPVCIPVRQVLCPVLAHTEEFRSGFGKGINSNINWTLTILNVLMSKDSKLSNVNTTALCVPHCHQQEDCSHFHFFESPVLQNLLSARSFDATGSFSFSAAKDSQAPRSIPLCYCFHIPPLCLCSHILLE